MSLAISPTRAAVGVGVPKPFGGQGGTAPYTYSKVEGVGTFNSATGLYTAPSTIARKSNGASLGFATLRVTDALGATAEAEVSVLSPLELVCDIIQQELGLDDGRVYIWDQQILSPSDSGLFVPIAIANCKPYSNSRKLDDDGNAVQSTNFRAQLDINFISKGPEARDRKEELVLALNSVYSEQQQNLNSFRLFPVPINFVDLSGIDGAAIPYRFLISVNVSYAVTKTKAAPFYDTFSDVEVWTDPDVQNP